MHLFLSVFRPYGLKMQEDVFCLFSPWHSGVFVLMDLKEKIVKSMLMTAKIMTVKITLRVSMELITTRAFAHLSTQVGSLGNAVPSICVSV